MLRLGRARPTRPDLRRRRLLGVRTFSTTTGSGTRPPKSSPRPRSARFGLPIPGKSSTSFRAAFPFGIPALHQGGRRSPTRRIVIRPWHNCPIPISRRRGAAVSSTNSRSRRRSPASSSTSSPAACASCTGTPTPTSGNISHGKGPHDRLRLERAVSNRRFQQGDAGYVPRGYGHYVENVGDEPCASRSGSIAETIRKSACRPGSPQTPTRSSRITSRSTTRSWPSFPASASSSPRRMGPAFEEAREHVSC